MFLVNQTVVYVFVNLTVSYVFSCESNSHLCFCVNQTVIYVFV